MTAKEYLWKIKGTAKSLVALGNELEVIQTRKEGLSSIMISEKVKSSDIYKGSLDDLICQEEEILKEQRAVKLEWWRCRQLIRQIKDNQQSDTLRYFYLLDYPTWEDVARKIHVSDRTIYYLHGNALKEFRKISGFS